MHRKKISRAYEDSAPASGTEKDSGGDGEGNDGSGYLIKAYFGDELLFACYEFLHEMHIKPKNFTELFEFLGYAKVRNIMRETALASARAGTQNG